MSRLPLPPEAEREINGFALSSIVPLIKSSSVGIVVVEFKGFMVAPSGDFASLAVRTNQLRSIFTTPFINDVLLYDSLDLNE